MPEELLICPECGRDLTGIDPWAHALDHWPERLDPSNSSPEARRRQAILKEMAKRGPV